MTAFKRFIVMLSVVSVSLVAIGSAQLASAEPAKTSRMLTGEPGTFAHTGRVTVGYTSTGRTAASSSVRSEGGTVVRTAPLADVIVVTPPTGESADSFAEQIARRPGVAYAEPEVRMQSFVVPNDPYFGQQWGIDASRGIRMPAAWDVTMGAAGVKVAVLDTGLRSSHVDAPTAIAAQKDLVDGDNVAEDPNGHGTHVSGIIASPAGNGVGVAGVAPGVTIVPVRVLETNGSGSDVTAAQGIIYAADQGADVINMSFGGPESSTTLESAIAYARGKGCVLVAAAGNGATYSGYVPGTLAYPAASRGVISVGSVGIPDPFSAFPAMKYYNARSPFSQYGWGLDLVAPGARIISLGVTTAGGAPSNSAYIDHTGTSMAAPHVTGTVALLRSVHPTWTADEIELALEHSAQDLGATGFDPYFGNGMVRADRVLGLTQPPAVPPDDDDIPGVPAGTNPVAGIVEWQGDSDDVYSIEASAGQTIELTLRSSAKDLDLLLFGPGASTVLDQTVAKARSTAMNTSSERISYTVPAGQSGTYYVNVFAYKGGAPYTLYWWKGIKTVVTVAAPSKVTLGDTIKLSGRFATDMGAAFAGRSLSVEALPSGSKVWRRVATAVTNSSGAYAVRIKPDRTTKYRIRAPWQSGHLTALSPARTVTAYSYLSRPKAPSRVKRGRKFTSSGFMYPRHKAGAKTVQLRLYRRQSGRWKLRKVVSAKNMRYSSTTTQYRARLSLPYKGRWRIVAKVRADSRHATTYSTRTYVTVR